MEAFPKVAWEEAGLTTQTKKNMIFVQPSARNGWRQFMESTTRDPSLTLQVHSILDGSYLTDESDLESYR